MSAGNGRHSSIGDDGSVEARLARLEAVSATEHEEYEARLGRLEREAREVPAFEGRYLVTDAAVTALANQGREFAAFQREQRKHNKWVEKSLVRVQAMPLGIVAYFLSEQAGFPPAAVIPITMGAFVLAFAAPELAHKILARTPAGAAVAATFTPKDKDKP